MLEMKKFTSKLDHGYYVTEKIGKQTAGLFVYNWIDTTDRAVYAIGAGVAKSKRQLLRWFGGKTNQMTDKKTGEYKITGDGNIAPLAWIAEALSGAEEYVRSQTEKDIALEFIIEGSDDRRHRVYTKYLGRKGYTLNDENQLCKNIV